MGPRLYPLSSILLLAAALGTGDERPELVGEMDDKPTPVSSAIHTAIQDGLRDGPSIISMNKLPLKFADSNEAAAHRSSVKFPKRVSDKKTTTPGFGATCLDSKASHSHRTRSEIVEHGNG